MVNGKATSFGARACSGITSTRPQVPVSSKSKNLLGEAVILLGKTRKERKKLAYEKINKKIERKPFIKEDVEKFSVQTTSQNLTK